MKTVEPSCIIAVMDFYRNKAIKFSRSRRYKKMEAAFFKVFMNRALEQAAMSSFMIRYQAEDFEFDKRNN